MCIWAGVLFIWTYSIIKIFVSKLKASKKQFYGDIVSPQIQGNYRDFCPMVQWAEILTIISLGLGKNDVFIKSFWFLLTFSVHINLPPKLQHSNLCYIVAPDGENGYFPLCTKQVIKPWVPLRDIWSLKIPVFWADFPSTHCSQSVWDWLRSTVCSSAHH